ncbi:hypothetical protein [Pseudomonas sp. SDO55104_S430]
MFKRSIGLLSLLLLAGCQTAQYSQYVASCPQMDIPLSCSINYHSRGCETADQAVESCARFVDQNVKAEEIRQAQAKGFNVIRYENEGAQKILLGFDRAGNSSRAVYVDASNLNAYVRSVDAAKSLMASKVSQYQAAMSAYTSKRAAGQSADVESVKEAYEQLQKMVGPLMMASEQGAPISRFYETMPAFDYELTAIHFTSQFGNRNQVLTQGWRRANRQHRATQTFPAEVLAVVSVAQFQGMASDISTRWARTYANDRAGADRAAAEHQRVKARATAAQERQRKYHQTYQAPSKPRKSTGYSDGSCSCRGGNVCYGPRGGRYCITSGGNKRYGI